MEKELSELFADQHANQVDWHGPLFGLLDLPTEVKSISVLFVTGNDSIRQGIALKIRGGVLSTNGVQSTAFELWRDTAPGEVTVDVTWEKRAARLLRVWNIWEEGGSVNAWLRNAAMRVTSPADRIFELRCSDGIGEPDFADLVARITVHTE